MQSNFELNLIEDLPVLERVDINGVRHYVDLEGTITDPYPSVTSVLGADKSKDKSLADWRARVGEEEANKISRQAAMRGTDVHLMIEDYILGQENQKKMMPNIVAMFKGLKELADNHINNIRLVEGQLFSHHLRVAGTVDLVAEYDGKLSVIDWKTARAPKKREYIHNYFIQESAYAVMFEERTNIPVDQLVTLLVHPEGTQVFVEKRDDWIGKFEDLRKEYDRQKSA